jgi:hypothetical protein
MLDEAMKALRVTNKVYETEIAHWLMAAANDLKMGGVDLGGDVTFTIGTADTVVDNCTVEDEFVKRALITYTAAHFGNPPNAAMLRDDYREQKAQLMHATGYTDYGEEVDSQ